MKVQQFRLDGAYKLAIDTMAANTNSQVVLVFGSRQQLLENNWFALVTKMYPKANVLSASTAGEIYENDNLQDALTVTALELQHTPVAAQSVNSKNYNNDFEAGVALAKKFDRRKLTLLLIITDGHLVKTNEVLRGLYKEIPDSVKVAGALAADDSNFQMPLVGLNNLPDEGNIAAIAFYGSQIKTTLSSSAGWEPFGPVRTITRSEGNTLFDLDNNPALQLYKEYLGERSLYLPASAMLFPLYLAEPGGAYKVIRTAVDTDEQEQSMTFAGEMPLGSKVQLMKHSYSKLIDSVSSAAEAALAHSDVGAPALSLVFSGAGRKLALGPKSVEEIENIRSVFGKSTFITGFYSFGEIAERTDSKKSAVQNQSITLLTLHETEKPLNPMLQRQLKTWFNTLENLPPEVKAFSESVNEAYNHYEEDLTLNNRVLEISSRELQEANDKIQQVNVKQQEALDKLRNTIVNLSGNKTLNPQQAADLNNIESLFKLISNELEGHKIHESDLQHAVEEAEKANRFKSMFIANVSHEIRTQLNAITGFTTLLAKDASTQESGEFLEIIKSSVDLLTHLLNDIIDMTKIEEGKVPIEKIPFRFHEVVSNAISPFRLKANEKGLYVMIDFGAIPENLVGDYHRFSQVLINLVNNAIKFTEKGGIKIAFSKIENAALPANYIMLKCSVEDTGIGISAEGKEKIFESFTQADSSIERRFGGSGLGLTISKDLVKLMGGEMGISKTKPEGEGSEFYFTIPLEVQQANVSAEINGTVKNVNSNYRFEHPLNILVADDDLINQKLMKKVLGNMNCSITVAGNGEQVLQELLENKYDAVLMDVEMPKLNGFEATRVIREQLNSKLPIIGLTAHADAGNRQKGISAGMNDFIVKPIDEGLLFNTLYKYTRQG